jgi:hypothetical protein
VLRRHDFGLSPGLHQLFIDFALVQFDRQTAQSLPAAFAVTAHA